MPKCVPVLVALCLVRAACGAPTGVDDATQEAARKLYLAAFNDELKAEDRVKTIESVVADFPQTRWADDALWVLGEVAGHRGEHEQALQLRRRLVAGGRQPKLEPFTCKLPVYEASRVPLVTMLLDRTGKRYRRTGRRVVEFNPLPMMVYEQLGRDYERLGQYDQAAYHYRCAAMRAPGNSVLRTLFMTRVERAVEKHRAQQSRRKARGEGPPGAGRAPQPEGTPTPDPVEEWLLTLPEDTAEATDAAEEDRSEQERD